ncbi:unnamed protein product [Paramecium octaurelia]|uniref:WD40-repeat-containing domain n=1 Tax=Paramecium octaurelia TaxID=43137 RepID=A0A8S1W951_PAROT|nr:unnamed protein product [Paramecium octaurelia]
METNQNNLQQDQENDHYFICTSPQCQNRGCFLPSRIQNIHQNCNVLSYKQYVDSIENNNDQFFQSETFQNYDQKLKQYLKKIQKLQKELKEKSLIFNNIKTELNEANAYKNKLKQLLQEFKDKLTQSNFEVLEQAYQSYRQQKSIKNIQRNFQIIENELKINQYLLSIDQVELQDDDNSSDEDSSDDESSDDLNTKILNQQLDPEAQELENKYNQVFNFLRNNAKTQVQQHNEELQSQQQEQNQSQQGEEQTNIKFIEKLGNNLIIVATENQLRIYDLISKSFQSILKQINAKITSLQVTNFEQVIVVGKYDGDIGVLDWNPKQKSTSKPRIFRVSNEEGRLFVEKLQSRHIACLGRDGNCKIYETTNFDVINSFKLDQGDKVVPTCFFAISQLQFFIGAEKTLFFNKKKIDYIFNGKIKQICQFGNRWLVADETTIYILVQNGEFISLLKEFHFSPKQIIYMTTFYQSQCIFINTKSAKSDDYENQVATIQISGEQVDLQLKQLDMKIQVKLLKGYQNNNETFLYGIDGFNVIEHKMIRDNDNFIVL